MARKAPSVPDTTALLPHVVISGNPGDGFKVYGPFPGPVSAIEWAHGDNPEADSQIPAGESWWVMPIYPSNPLADVGRDGVNVCEEFTKAIVSNEAWAYDLVNARSTHPAKLSFDAFVEEVAKILNEHAQGGD